MRSGRIACSATFSLVGIVVAPIHAQVFTSEFFADPVSEGWELVGEVCEPETWNDQGWYHQQLDLDACPPAPGGGAEAYVLWLTEFNGQPQFFLEFRVQTNGDRSEIPYGAPTGAAMGNFYGVSYHVRVARDLAKFARDIDLPVWFFEIEPRVPHTYRIELYPDRYVFYLDGGISDEGVPEGPFPAHDSRVTWSGRSWYHPCHNAWDYIRHGVTPVDGSADFDSDTAVTLDDYYFVHECLTNERPGINGGPGQDAGPGCRFADFDSDSDVDLKDIARLQVNFTGGG